MCGVPLPWWQEELDKDKKEQEQQKPIPSNPAEEDAEQCD